MASLGGSELNHSISFPPLQITAFFVWNYWPESKSKNDQTRFFLGRREEIKIYSIMVLLENPLFARCFVIYRQIFGFVEG